MASHFEIGERCLFSNIYALSDLVGKSLMWSHITFVWSLDPFLPWTIARFFNVVTNLEEKRGRISRLGPSSSMLRDNIGYLNLIDVKFGSIIFTWNNIRSGTKVISERLDKFLVSFFWLDIRWSTR